MGRFLNADGLVSTGQGLIGNNMFTYCGNNPVVRADSTGKAWYGTAIYWFLNFLGSFSYTPASIKTSTKLNNILQEQNTSTTTSNKIINDQNGKTGSQFSYGDFQVKDNGCAPIAVHNAKVLKGIDSTLSDTISDFESTRAIIGNGALGTNPYAIGKVLDKNGIPYSRVDRAFSMTSAGTYIISYSWDGRISGGAHVVAVQFDGKAYATYNLYGDGDVYDYSPFIYAQHFICGYYLG